jgi:hypothetical protein
LMANITIAAASRLRMTASSDIPGFLRTADRYAAERQIGSSQG